MQSPPCARRRSGRFMFITLASLAAVATLVGADCQPHPHVINGTSASIDIREDGSFVDCGCDGACIITVVGAVSRELQATEAVHAAVRPLVTPEVGFFVQVVPASTTGDSWNTAAELGSARYPPQEGDQFELRAVIVDVTDGEIPVGPFEELTIETIPGLVAVSDAVTVTVDCPCPAPPQTVFLETPQDGNTITCGCNGVCTIAMEGTVRCELLTTQVVHVAVRPLVMPDIGFFVQEFPASTSGVSWNTEAELGSAEFPPQDGDRFELRAVIVNVTGGDVPVGPFEELSIDTIPGLLADSEPVTVTVRCDTFEERLFQFFDQRQNDRTGFLPSFDMHDDLPDEFKDFLGNNPGFLYDNALAALAYVERGRDADLERAGRILCGMLTVQKDTGAFPDAINVLTGQDIPTPDFGTGNQMWAVLALLKGYDVWRISDPDRALNYLEAAEAAADFVLVQTNNQGCGGFVLFPGSTLVSTEHNADAYAAFSRLADVLASRGDVTAAETFRTAAAHARIFVECMFDEETGKSWTGTTSRELTINKFPVPEDTQTWPILSLGGTKWTRSLDWLFENLWTTAGSCAVLDGVAVCGPSFSNADSSEVWFEGLGHIWVAAQATDRLNHLELQRCPPMRVLEAVQRSAPHTDGYGIVATCDTLDTGFNFSFFNTPAVAPTAWAIFGVRSVNPFWGIRADAGLSAHPRADASWVALDAPPNLEYACETGDPCVFEVTGSTANVAGGGSLAIHIVINPTNPSAGARFVQASPATVSGQGLWTAVAQLGSQEFPASDGDAFEVSAIIVDTSAGGAPTTIDSITRLEIPALVATSGILPSTVRISR